MEHGIPALSWEDDTARRGPGARELLPVLRQAVEQNPDRATVHRELGRILLETGSGEEAEEAFRKALELDGDSPEADLGLGRSLSERGRLQDALPHLSAAARALPTHFHARYHLGRTLARVGRHDEALAELRTASRLDPRHFHALHNLVRIHLIRGRPEEALSELDENLERIPGNAAALALKGQVLTEAGRREEASALRAFDRLLRSFRPGAPSGWSGTEAFLRDLADFVRSRKELEYEPQGVSTRGGSQTRLSGAGQGPDAALFRLVRSAMEEYREAVASGPPHPLLGALPGRARLVMWTVVLRKGGHQLSHIHPGGWVSAVYYVAVPSGGPEVAGPLELGGRDHLLPLVAAPETRTVHPEEGLLVLFPSFYYHRTIPTGSDEERICVAFNMVPVE